MKNMQDPKRMAQAAERASALMKTLGHPGRLMVLCNLAEGELSVGELEQRVPLGQSALSQQLARMRVEGLVAARREAQQVYYRLEDGQARQLIETLYQVFCPE